MIITALALTLAAVPSATPPVQLSCRLSASLAAGEGDPDVVWTIAINESSNTVRWAIPDMGLAETASGTFTADEVRFATPTSTFIIDRDDLSFARSTPAGGRQATARGRCFAQNGRRSEGAVARVSAPARAAAR